MRKKIIVLTLALGMTLALRAASRLEDIKIEIPFKKYVLTNGLTLIVHEDHKAPIVAVDIWYHVGSKNEVPGKTGFAHLFEHLMFSGSGHFQEGGNQRAFFEAMERVGATDLNGTTGPDRTDFFENVPKNALDVALWLESDRMGDLLEAVDQHKLDVQRGVVQNEKRQGENQPYGLVDELVTHGTAPPEHPYSWTTIGSMEDLNAASLDDVKAWFRKYYGTANAVIVLAGDIDPETARKKVEHYFGNIPSGPPVARFHSWIPHIAGTRRQTATDRVPLGRLYKVWNTPAYGEADSAYLGLASEVLSSGKTSRLYKRLVYDDQIANDVSASEDANELSGQFTITATAKPGVDLAKIEKAIDEEVARFLSEGPTEKELDRVKVASLAGFVRGAERIGGFGGKADILAMNEAFRGNPEFYKTPLEQERSATRKDVLAAAKRWLTDDVYILEVHPFPTYETANETVDRTKLPTPGEPPVARLPEFQHATLANGLKVILAERHAIPVVNFTLLLDAGSASDQFSIPGTAKLAMDMIDEGTKTRSALQISEELGTLGARLGAGSDVDSSTVSLSALKATLDPALEIYADVVLNPSFPDADFKRLQKQRLTGIQREKSEPVRMAMRVFPGILYGKQHAYGNPMTGSGTEESVAKICRDDMEKFHRTWFKPNHATLIIVGDTTLKEVTPKLEKLLAQWKPGDVPAKNIGPVAPQKAPVICLLDRPGAIQSILFAGEAAPPKANPDEIAIETMNSILGGTFTSRINLNLREDKHWSYGAQTLIPDARGPRPFIAYASVQTDKTKESMIEMDKELRGILGPKPVSADELKKAQDSQTLELPGSWETNDRVGGSIGEIVRFGLPEDYFTTFPGKVRALSVNDVAAAAAKVLHPDRMVWIVVGDRAKIEPGIRELGWGEIKFLDADGNPVKSAH